MKMTRRKLLATTSRWAGGLGLLPLMANMVAKLETEAAAAGGDKTAAATPPWRVVFVVEGNGLPWAQIQPMGLTRRDIASGTYTGRSGKVREGLTDKPLTGLTLPASLEPVKAHQDRLTIIQGLSGKMCSGGHSNDFGALGAYNSRGGVGHTGTPAAETVDHAIGRHLGGLFSQIGLGISDRVDDTVVYNSSASGAGKPLPTQCRPDLAYQALFGSVAGGEARRAFESQRSLLDHMVADIKRAETGLAGPEREKLQTYLAAFEAMRNRHGRLVELEGRLRTAAPPVTNKFTSAVETDRLDAQFSLAGAALIAGLTDVVTIASGVGNPYFSVRFTGLGIDFAKHGIGHGGSYNGWSAEQMSVMIRKLHFELIDRLVTQLKAVPEGAGTMWDNTLVVYLSDAAEGHHSRCWEWPVVMLGHLGGRLRAGRYLDFPGHGARGHRHIGQLYTTLLNAVGDSRESFGQPDMILGRDVDQRGGIPELLV